MARALHVLLVDDDENDTLLVRLATNSLGQQHSLHTVNGGREAVAYLEGVAAKRHAIPNLLLIDLKMPCLNGLEFLSWLRCHPELGTLPAVVLSGSGLGHDVKTAYQFGATGYVTKPLSFDELSRQLKALYDFWSACEFPRAASGKVRKG
jgi:CheY-like chemotaxis protein